MDEELKQELRKINTGVNRLNTRIDKLDKEAKRNTLDANKVTLTAIGLSLVVAGVILQFQQNDWSSSGFFVFAGTFLALLAIFWGTPHFKKYMKCVRIALWLSLSATVGLTVYIIIALLFL